MVKSVGRALALPKGVLSGEVGAASEIKMGAGRQLKSRVCPDAMATKEVWGVTLPG